MLKKWWFWVIILAIISIISFAFLQYIKFNNSSKDLSKEVVSIYNKAEVYMSRDNGTIFIELHHYRNEENTEQLSQIIQLIREKKENNELQEYNKLKTIAYFDNDEGQESMLIIDAVNLDDYTKEESISYILFEEYQELYENLQETTTSYSELFDKLY